MIRPFTVLCALLASGSGLYLYQTKHQAQLLDRQIEHIRAATQATLTRAGMVRADYALLNDPERLADLTAQYLPNLRPTQPTQWTSMADLDRRLPPVATPASDVTPPEPAEPMAQAEPKHPTPAPTVGAKPADTAEPVVAGVAPPPAQDPPRTVVAARPVAQTPRPTDTPPPQQLAAAIPKPAPARRPPPPAPQVARVLAPPPVITAAALPPPSTQQHNGRAAEPSVYAPEVVSRVVHPAEPTAPVFASALGMARSMPALNASISGATYPRDTAR
jgi:hypothetical protein